MPSMVPPLPWKAPLAGPETQLPACGALPTVLLRPPASLAAWLPTPLFSSLPLLFSSPPPPLFSSPPPPALSACCLSASIRASRAALRAFFFSAAFVVFCFFVCWGGEQVFRLLRLGGLLADCPSPCRVLYRKSAHGPFNSITCSVPEGEILLRTVTPRNFIT